MSLLLVIGAFLLAVYTCLYARYLFKTEKDKLAGTAVLFVGIMTFLTPLFVYVFRR